MRAEVFRISRVRAVASNTFREAMRNRAFLGLGLFGVLFILFSLVLSELTVVGQGPRVVVDFGFFAVGLFAAATAIVMGALLVYKEVDKKTIYTILSKPLHRYEFIVGKYLGMVSILAAQVIVLALIWTVPLVVQGADVSVEHAKGMLLIVFEVSIVAAVAVMFSAQSTPALTGLLSVGVFVVGRLVYMVEEMLGGTKGLFVDNPIARLFGQGVVAVAPDLSVFNVSQQVLLGVEVSWAYIGHAVVYAVCYVVIILGIAVLGFQRRDFV